MVKNYTLNEIKFNLENFNHKLINKDLKDNFWIIADRIDFKPLTKDIVVNKKIIKKNINTIKDIKEIYLGEKWEYYKEKKFAQIHVFIDEELLTNLEKSIYKNIKNKIILSVNIKIYLIDHNGNIKLNNKWELKVNYNVQDLTNIHFKLKNIEVLMRLAYDSVITTNNIKGINYKTLLTKINN